MNGKGDDNVSEVELGREKRSGGGEKAKRVDKGQQRYGQV
jgi:hypothetical protein